MIDLIRNFTSLKLNAFNGALVSSSCSVCSLVLVLRVAIWLIVLFVLRVRQQIGQNTRLPTAEREWEGEKGEGREREVEAVQLRQLARRVHNNLNARHTKERARQLQLWHSGHSWCSSCCCCSWKWLRDRTQCNGLHLNPGAVATKLARQRDSSAR